MQENMRKGEVASLFNVAPETVTGWFDRGEISGFRDLGSRRDRVFPSEEVIKFGEKHEIPIGAGGVRLTTGQMASLCKAAPRTVSGWFDDERLKGYRIPGPGGDRRIPRENAVQFLKENGMPVDVALRKFVLWGEDSIIQDTREELERIVGETGEVIVVEDAFSAGHEMHNADCLIFEEASSDLDQEATSRIDSDQITKSLERNKKIGMSVSSSDFPSKIVLEIRKQLAQQQEEHDVETEEVGMENEELILKLLEQAEQESDALPKKAA